MSKKTKVEIEADLLPMTQWEIKLVVTMTEGGNSLIDLMDNQGKKKKVNLNTKANIPGNQTVVCR